MKKLFIKEVEDSIKKMILVTMMLKKDEKDDYESWIMKSGPFFLTLPFKSQQKNQNGTILDALF